MVNEAYWLGCLVGLFMHEAAHAGVALSLGLQVKRFGMNWRGPYTVRQTGAPMQNAMIIAAGPLVNLLLALLTWQSSVPFAVANLVLGLSNLIPTRNSDGSKFVREFELARNAYKRAMIVSPTQLTSRTQ